MSFPSVKIMEKMSLILSPTLGRTADKVDPQDNLG